MRALIFAALAVSLTTPAQAPPPTVIEAKDGDVILVKDRAAVRVVRRIDAEMRAIYNPQQRWLVILLDQDAAPTSGKGGVDVSFTFNDVDGAWPLGERWQGRVTVDEYSFAGEGGAVGLGLHSSSGLIQLLPGGRSPRSAAQVFRDAAAVAAVTFSGSGRGGGGNQGFDAAEERQTAVAARNAASIPPGTSFRSGLDFRIEGGAAAESSLPSRYPPPGAPVRVGGNIRTPARITDASPVMPEVARQAGVRGVVIVEITIAPDGSVSNAKILRSIPLLDAAALEAVRQWRYEPTFLNGAAVPVIMTVTVNFP